MALITQRQVIDAPIARVFNAVIDAGNYAAWNPTITASRRLDEGELREGSRFEWQLKGFGTVIQEFHEFERNARVRIVPRIRWLSGGHRFLFSAQGLGTRIDHELEIVPRGILLLLGPMIARTARRNLRETVEALQAHIEGKRPASAVYFKMSQTIRRPVSEVFDTVIRLDEFPKWSPRNPWAKKLTSGEIGEGTRFEMGIKGFGKITNELHEFDRNKRVMVAPLTKMLSGGHRWLFTDLGNGETRIDHELELEPKGFFKLVKPLLRASGEKTVKETAEALREFLEAERPHRARRPRPRRRTVAWVEPVAILTPELDNDAPASRKSFNSLNGSFFWRNPSRVYRARTRA